MALACLTLAAADRLQSAQTKQAIVFERSGDLYAIAVDGSRTVRLTKTRLREWDPAVSRDGSKVAFARGFLGISTIRIDGSHRTIITHGHDFGPAWGSGGQTLYFVRHRDTRFGDCGSIFRVSLREKKHFQRVTNTIPTGHSHLDPAVSPDRRSIAFSDWNRCEGGTSSPRLRVVDGHGRPTVDLARLRHNGFYPDPEHASPAWSPDGRRLAFFADGDLTIANRDGSGAHRIARGNTYQPPAWSSDGRWIAFLDSPGDSDQQLLLLVHPGGTGRHRIAVNVDSIGGWVSRRPKGLLHR